MTKARMDIAKSWSNVDVVIYKCICMGNIKKGQMVNLIPSGSRLLATPIKKKKKADGISLNTRKCPGSYVFVQAYGEYVG